MNTEFLHTEQDTPESLWKLIGEIVAILWKDWPMDMEVSIYDEGGMDKSPEFTLRGHCPHCLRDAVFTQVTTVFIENSRPLAGTSRWVAGLQCQGCLKCILGLVVHDPNRVMSRSVIRYETHYPLDEPNDTVAAEIPEPIADDFSEALRCFWVDAYNATAEMCRRAIEASCINLGAPASHKFLDDKIDWLESQRKITPLLRDVAHKIRLGGNRAAHPGNMASATPEPKIEKEHAEAIIEFTRQFFHHVYVVPKQLDKYDFSKPKASATKATTPSKP